MIRPIDHFEWQILRALVRAGRRPLPGRQLRLAPIRRSKDGTFLDALVKAGLVEVAAIGPVEPHIPGSSRRAPDQFRRLYKLTELGKHAAEYGEYEDDFDARRKAS